MRTFFELFRAKERALRERSWRRRSFYCTTITKRNLKSLFIRFVFIFSSSTLLKPEKTAKMASFRGPKKRIKIRQKRVKFAGFCENFVNSLYGNSSSISYFKSEGMCQKSRCSRSLACGASNCEQNAKNWEIKSLIEIWSRKTISSALSRWACRKWWMDHWIKSQIHCSRCKQINFRSVLKAKNPVA